VTVILRREVEGRELDALEARQLPGTNTAVLHSRMATVSLSHEDWARLARIAYAWSWEGVSVHRCEECKENTPHDGTFCLVCQTECCSPEDGRLCPRHAEEARCLAEERSVTYAEEERRE
jgi:hypothetical protein